MKPFEPHILRSTSLCLTKPSTHCPHWLGALKFLKHSLSIDCASPEHKLAFTTTTLKLPTTKRGFWKGTKTSHYIILSILF